VLRFIEYWTGKKIRKDLQRCTIITTCASKYRPCIQFNFPPFIHMQKDVDIDRKQLPFNILYVVKKKVEV
jgi:hypothetical protein